MKGKEIEAFARREITCPYCGYEFSDSWEHHGLDNDGDSQEEECPECEKKFHVKLDISHDYTSHGLCEENKEEHDWESFDHTTDGKRCKGRKCLTCGKYEFDRETLDEEQRGKEAVR